MLKGITATVDLHSSDHPRQAVRSRAPQTLRNYRRHWSKWNGCHACPLHRHVCNHVIASGQVPCQVVFIGEAPGEVEDTLGKPFVGRAGKVLQEMIAEIQRRLPTPITYAITNTVACKPFPKGAEICKPEREHIEACLPRLVEFLKIARPQMIVALGDVAFSTITKYDPAKDLKVDVVKAWHPSYVLRHGGKTSLEFKKVVLQLVSIFKTL